MLNVDCDKCGRRGRYRLHRLIERYGIDAKLFDWFDEITADCPRKQANNLNDICGARCPDLSKGGLGLGLRIRSLLPNGQARKPFDLVGRLSNVQWNSFSGSSATSSSWIARSTRISSSGSASVLSIGRFWAAG